MNLLAEIDIIESWQWHGALRLVIAVLLGGAVGIEREIHGRAAGFRTHALVCLGSCLVMWVSIQFGRVYGDLGSNETAIRVDPARIAYSVMTGIGFIGAGVILKTKTGVRGLTTAASLWSAAALGLGVGFGLYFIAVVTTILMLIVLMLLRAFEAKMPVQAYRSVKFIVAGSQHLEKIRGELQSDGAKIVATHIAGENGNSDLTIQFRLRYVGERDAIALHEFLGRFDNVSHVEVR